LTPQNNISEHYRRRVEEITENQPGLFPYGSLMQEEEDIIWEEISTEMDLGEVWVEIINELDQPRSVNVHIGFIIRSVAAILIIILAIIPVEKSIRNPEIIKPDIVQNVQPENRPVEIIKDTAADPDKVTQSIIKFFSDERKDRVKSEDGKGTLQVAMYDTNPESISCDTREVRYLEPVASPHADVLSRPVYPGETSLELTSIASIINNDRLNLEDHRFEGASPSRFRTGGKFSVGLSALFKNTWLLNYETFNGLKSTSLTTTVMVFSPDIGVSFNYALNENWTLQNEGFFYSSAGQEYYKFEDGGHPNIDYTLKYSTIALSSKYKFRGRKEAMIRTSLNLTAGSYLSVLHKAGMRKDNVLENVSTDFTTLDYGIRLVSEFEFYFSNHFSSAPGIFLSYGIPNIYKGDFMKTNNCSAGLQIVCFYTF